MRTFSRASQFKQDVKRAGKRGQELHKLKDVMEWLIIGRPLPPEFVDHPLRGDFAGSRDCHIESDWVLIYSLTHNDDQASFERTGSPSDLFRQQVPRHDPQVWFGHQSGSSPTKKCGWFAKK